MKPDIHPEYREVVFKDTSSDLAFLTRSTIETSETIEWEDGNTYPFAKVEISQREPPFLYRQANTCRLGGPSGEVPSPVCTRRLERGVFRCSQESRSRRRHAGRGGIIEPPSGRNGGWPGRPGRRHDARSLRLGCGSAPPRRSDRGQERRTAAAQRPILGGANSPPTRRGRADRVAKPRFPRPRLGRHRNPERKTKRSPAVRRCGR